MSYHNFTLPNNKISPGCKKLISVRAETFFSRSTYITADYFCCFSYCAHAVCLPCVVNNLWLSSITLLYYTGSCFLDINPDFFHISQLIKAYSVPPRICERKVYFFSVHCHPKQMQIDQRDL